LRNVSGALSGSTQPEKHGNAKILSRFAGLLRTNWHILLCGLFLEAGFAASLWATVASNLLLLPQLFFVLFATYIVSIFVMRRIPNSGTAAVAMIILFAFAFRMTLLFSGPVFSFDMYRYIWDGKIASNGINPFVYPPDAPELAFLRDSNWWMVNHKYLLTGYPPLMEILFELLYILFRTLFAYKITFFIFDLATIGVILLILRELKLDQRYLAIYAWAPLPVFEVTQTGHNDSLAVFLLFLSFLFLIRGRRYPSAVAMSLAVLAKLYPIFFAPIFFKKWGKGGVVTFMSLLIALHLPYANIGLDVYKGLLYAINTTNFNGSVFPLMTWLFARAENFPNPGFAAQIVTYAVYTSLLVLVMVRTLKDRKESTTALIKGSFLLTGTLLLLTRSFFPWYVVWILPYLAIFPSNAWLLLSGTVFAGYFKYCSFPPPDYECVNPQTALLIDIIEYAPFYALLVYELVRNHGTISTWKLSLPLIIRPLTKVKRAFNIVTDHRSISIKRTRGQVRSRPIETTGQAKTWGTRIQRVNSKQQ
jgi:hypothetical protein